MITTHLHKRTWLPGFYTGFIAGGGGALERMPNNNEVYNSETLKDGYIHAMFPNPESECNTVV